MVTEPVAKKYFGLHLVENFVWRISTKRSPSSDEFKQQNPKGPYIDFIIIWSILNHLRRHVFVSATKSLPLT